MADGMITSGADLLGLRKEAPEPHIHAIPKLDVQTNELTKAFHALTVAFDEEIAKYGSTHETRDLTCLFEDFREHMADKISVIINSKVFEEQLPGECGRFVNSLHNLKDTFGMLEQLHTSLDALGSKEKGPFSLALECFEEKLHHFIEAVECRAQPLLAENAGRGMLS